ncbi:hypothetical protein NLI96_g7199 [Meripilus lineatus]|uniref:Uncharacterized protein n=1 Tax=Meripilus lineatus TaxID=2056292 RepID=A0AAD5YF85_9APHY|nr:hypothetical protein NLI96_g7199 [Physisporinus lineatus]
MSSPMSLRFMYRIRDPGIVTLADKIETTFATSSPLSGQSHKITQPEVMGSAPIGPLVHNLVLSADKSRALATVNSLRLEVHKYEREIKAKDGAIGTLETSLLASREICKTLVNQLSETQEKGRTLELELSASQGNCKSLSIQLSESQGKEQATSCLAKETQDRLETVEEDLDETSAELAELRITVQNEQAARRTLQQLVETETKQHQYILDVLRAKCSTTRNERDKKAKECNKWRQEFADYNARTQEGFKEKDKQITDLRTQLTQKQKELDEAHNDWHIDKEESDWVKKRWEEAREDLEAAQNDINALNGELDQKDVVIADTRRELESLQEEFRAYRKKAEEDAQRQREHIETLYKELDESSEEAENCYVEIKDSLLRLDAAEDKASSLCAQVEERNATIQTLQARLDQANNDQKIAKEVHSLEISTLTGQLTQRDSVARISSEDTKADLEAANATISTLSSQISDKNTALSDAQAELTETKVALKVAEDKLCVEDAAHQDLVTFADTKILELSRELVQHDQLIAHLSECEEAALKDVARLEATNKDLSDRIITLEAQLSSILTAPSSDPIVSVDEVSAELENALANNAVLGATIKTTEVINADLTRAFEQECDAHDATRKDIQSLQTHLAVASKDLKVANEKLESLQYQMESREVEYHALEQKVSEVVAEMNKENAQLGQSKKSIEELLVAKVDRCDRLEKENLSLRGSQSSLANLSSSPLSNVTNASIPSPPVRAIQKKAGGSSWFNTGIFSPTASFRWSSRVSDPSPLASFSFSPSPAPFHSPSVLQSRNMSESVGHIDSFDIENVVPSVPPRL